MNTWVKTNLIISNQVFYQNQHTFLFTIAALIGEKRGFKTEEVVKRTVSRLFVDRKWWCLL